MNHSSNAEQRVAVLVDCDNVDPEILEYALHVVAQFGRIVLRRGYGNHTTLANKWRGANAKGVHTLPAIPICVGQEHI